MNIQETLALLQALKDCGATRFKSMEVEIDFSRGQAPIARESLPGGIPARPAAPIPMTVPEVAPELPPEHPLENKEAIERIRGLTTMLKMDDEALVNRLFPAGAGENPEP